MMYIQVYFDLILSVTGHDTKEKQRNCTEKETTASAKPNGQVCLMNRLSSIGNGGSGAFSKLRSIWINHLHYFFQKWGN